MKLLLNCVPNARDLGGIKTADGRVLKAGRLIRSGRLRMLDDTDIEYLRSINLETVVDFRTEQEQVEKPNFFLEGVDYISCPILKGRTEGITHEKPETEDEEAERTVKMARRMMPSCSDGTEQMRFLYTILVSDEHAIEHYRLFFELLLGQTEGAVLYNCMMGKDRTGIGTALLLSALGVSREDILRDYMITKERCAPGTERLLANCRRFTDNEAELKFIYDLDIVDESFLGAGFDTIDRRFGGVDAYLKNQMGLDDAKLTQLKNMYLE